MKIHLCTILPAGVLVALQFFPIIRYKVIMVHRINGWLVSLLLFISNAGALMIADRSFAGFLVSAISAGYPCFVIEPLSSWPPWARRLRCISLRGDASAKYPR